MEEIGYREGEERDDEVGSAVGESMYSVEINSWDELDIPKGYEIDDEGERDARNTFGKNTQINGCLLMTFSLRRSYR